MDACRLLVLGGSGTGTTTLGRAIADHWSVPHADADDYFWTPTDPPYVEKRPTGERIVLMEQVFLPRNAWVLSGSIMGWGDGLVECLDAVVFLTLDPAVRLARIEARERGRYGSAIDPGGDRATAFREFITWAAGYDAPDFDGRSRARQEAWLAASGLPVLHLDSAQPVAALVDAVVAGR